QLLLLHYRLELDHREIAAARERAVLVEHIGDAARHAGREIAAGRAEHHNDAAGHVLAAMVAGALHHRHCARVAHREALPSDAAEIALALDRAVEQGVADDEGSLRHDGGRLARRIGDDAPAGETLAGVIVGLAFELEGHTAREPGTEALTGRALELHVHGIVRQ